MVFAKAFISLVLALSLTLALASPVNETKILSKRGAVLTAQFATESEVSQMTLFDYMSSYVFSSRPTGEKLANMSFTLLNQDLLAASFLRTISGGKAQPLAVGISQFLETLS